MQLNFMDVKVINLLWSGTQASHVEKLPGQAVEGVEEEAGSTKGTNFFPLQQQQRANLALCFTTQSSLEKCTSGVNKENLKGGQTICKGGKSDSNRERKKGQQLHT